MLETTNQNHPLNPWRCLMTICCTHLNFVEPFWMTPDLIVSENSELWAVKYENKCILKNFAQRRSVLKERGRNPLWRFITVFNPGPNILFCGSGLGCLKVEAGGRYCFFQFWIYQKSFSCCEIRSLLISTGPKEICDTYPSEKVIYSFRMVPIWDWDQVIWNAYLYLVYSMQSSFENFYSPQIWNGVNISTVFWRIDLTLEMNPSLKQTDIAGSLTNISLDNMDNLWGTWKSIFLILQMEN